MSIRIDEPNCKVMLLGNRGENEYWLGDDNFVYQFRNGRRIGYLCTIDAWDRTFSKIEGTQLSPRTVDVCHETVGGDPETDMRLSFSIRCF